ncbi:hypothetical protein CISG_04320 [Coccidioides immitis RMSCC 3703]|uniref:Uncharacterized protein n=1 Tax=Coccidioides immitis RMSCC 3703 TaxID=454286 RepID=A0A0J8QTP3_COCIT|nr:hypothetical protein CISG_04320 [Coccidioides immitis RMSCC 3703]
MGGYVVKSEEFGLARPARPLLKAPSLAGGLKTSQYDVSSSKGVADKLTVEATLDETPRSTESLHSIFPWAALTTATFCFDVIIIPFWVSSRMSSVRIELRASPQTHLGKWTMLCMACSSMVEHALERFLMVIIIFISALHGMGSDERSGPFPDAEFLYTEFSRFPSETLCSDVKLGAIYGAVRMPNVRRKKSVLSIPLHPGSMSSPHAGVRLTGLIVLTSVLDSKSRLTIEQSLKRRSLLTQAWLSTFNPGRFFSCLFFGSKKQKFCTMRRFKLSAIGSRNREQPIIQYVAAVAPGKSDVKAADMTLAALRCLRAQQIQPYGIFNSFTRLSFSSSVCDTLEKKNLKPKLDPWLLSPMSIMVWLPPHDWLECAEKTEPLSPSVKCGGMFSLHAKCRDILFVQNYHGISVVDIARWYRPLAKPLFA